MTLHSPIRRKTLGMLCIALFCATPSPAEDLSAKTSIGFEGLWNSTFGPMRLRVDGDKVQGAYHYQGGTATILGQIENERLVFRYQEATARGEGWFELTDDGSKLAGKWKANGQSQWQDWRCRRSVPRPGLQWLVILEANWERSLGEPEYAFGEMLTNYFTMATARHVQVRHRFFHDATDLSRFCREVQFLAEPVVLLISTHGTTEGITVNGETIKAETIANGLASAKNLKLLHLSGCAMMNGDFPNEIQSSLGDQAVFPISGYKTNVAWDASAIGDFTYLSLLLIRKMSPEKAARHAITASPYLGTERVPGTAFRPLGLTVIPARR